MSISPSEDPNSPLLKAQQQQQNGLVVSCDETYFSSPRDGYKLFYRKWSSSSPSPGSNGEVISVYICHGMAEHSGRYDSFVKSIIGKLQTTYASRRCIESHCSALFPHVVTQKQTSALSCSKKIWAHVPELSAMDNCVHMFHVGSAVLGIPEGTSS